MDGTVARKADNALRVLSWFVLLVGAIIGAWALYLGFTAVEPWTSDSTMLGGFVVTEDWQSVALGFLGAAYVAVVFGTLWAFTLLGRAIAHYVERRGA
jgi:hypothetical protein